MTQSVTKAIGKVLPMCPITTPWTAKVNADGVLGEYPRPQMIRGQWANLNGYWQYAIAATNQPRPAKSQGRILVPFAVESGLSGVKCRLGPEEYLWYWREFVAPKMQDGDRLLLHFGAVDWECTIELNGKPIGVHRGGYDPFTFDITDWLKSEEKQELVVRVWDPSDSRSQPRGKQVLDPGGIWYTPVSGIWQTVWLEVVPEVSIASLRITPDVPGQCVRIQVHPRKPSRGFAIRAVALDGGKAVAESTGEFGQEFTLPIPNANLWSPDSPHLYDLEISVLSGQRVIDHVRSYFAMRQIKTQMGSDGFERVVLNDKPIFLLGPLDQGWWPDGLYTAPTDEALRFDIEMMKKFGFNMCRKHVKIEPQRWYYWADRLGLLVWQDMPSGMMRSDGPQFVRDGWPEDAKFSAEEGACFRRELEAMMRELHNHPCVMAWVPFNEGWGQHDCNTILRWVKQNDPSRLVDGPSGWADRGFGDMMDRHQYPGPGMFPAQTGRLSVLGEFGGLGLPVPGHLWQEVENWGYRTYRTQEELADQYEKLIKKLPPLIRHGLCAAIYTQWTDVETEVNGLLTYDRRVIKLSPEAILALHRKIIESV